MSHDTLVHQAVRPAIRLIAARTRVTPDHLTALRLVTGLSAAASFAYGVAVTGWMVLGTCLFLFSALLDRADGELARQTRRFSRYGHRWDLVADCTCTAAVFVGLGLGAADGALGRGSVVLGVLAGTGVVCMFWRVNVAGSGALPGYAGSSGRVLVDPDDAMFAVPVILWCAGTDVVLALAGILAPAAALWMCMEGVLGRRNGGMAASPLPPFRADATRSLASRTRGLAKQRR